MGIFIHIALEQDRLPFAERHRITALCPVDIFAVEGDQLVAKPEQEDECTLCELCLRAAPPGVIAIHKLYSPGEILLSGESHD